MRTSQHSALPLLWLTTSVFAHPTEPRTTQIASSDSYTLVQPNNGTWPYRKYVTTDSTSPVFVVEKNGERLAPGSIFITVASLDGQVGSFEAAYIMSPEGDLIYASPVEATSNFLTQSYNGKTVISTWTGEGSAAASGGAAHGYGVVDIYDSRYNLVKTVCPLASQLNITFPPGITSTCVADVHESYITTRNTMLVTVYNQTRADLSAIGGPKDGYIVDPLAVEMDLDTNEPVFIWSAAAHVPITASQAPLQKSGHNASEAYDFFHMNSIQSFNGGYLINSRNTWTSYFVNAQGQIEWELNGATGGSFGSLPTGYNFSWQHDARLHPYGNDSSTALYTIFNDYNGNEPALNPSTGLSLILNTTSGSFSAKPHSNLIDPADKLNALAEGSYQILNNANILLGYGVFPVFKEFGGNPANASDVRYTAQFGFNNLTTSSYRTFKDVWHATPSAPIDLVVINGTGYVSWNGATGVTSYSIYSNSGSDGMWASSGTSFEKKGFETSFQVPAGMTNIQIVAHEGSNQVGWSRRMTL